METPILYKQGLKVWKRIHRTKSLKWIVQIPNITPIEHATTFWEKVARKISQNSINYRTDALTEEWVNMAQQPIIGNLIKSLCNWVKDLEFVKGEGWQNSERVSFIKG